MGLHGLFGILLLEAEGCMELYGGGVLFTEWVNSFIFRPLGHVSAANIQSKHHTYDTGMLIKAGSSTYVFRIT